MGCGRGSGSFGLGSTGKSTSTTMTNGNIKQSKLVRGYKDETQATPAPSAIEIFVTAHGPTPHRPVAQQRRARGGVRQPTPVPRDDERRRVMCHACSSRRDRASTMMDARSQLSLRYAGRAQAGEAGPVAPGCHVVPPPTAGRPHTALGQL